MAPRRRDRISRTASKGSIPSSIRPIATRTGALLRDFTQSAQDKCSMNPLKICAMKQNPRNECAQTETARMQFLLLTSYSSFGSMIKSILYLPRPAIQCTPMLPFSIVLKALSLDPESLVFAFGVVESSEKFARISLSQSSMT